MKKQMARLVSILIFFQIFIIASCDNTRDTAKKELDNIAKEENAYEKASKIIQNPASVFESPRDCTVDDFLAFIRDQGLYVDIIKNKYTNEEERYTALKLMTSDVPEHNRYKENFVTIIEFERSKDAWRAEQEFSRCVSEGKWALQMDKVNSYWKNLLNEFNARCPN